jgi:tRNA pseudouridine55 synthase
MNGVVVVDKPGGWTSHDVVAKLRRIYGTKRVGHTGTLDPLATGVLVVCLGQATRIVEYLTAARKEYVAGFVFGVTTDSEDATGTILSESDASRVRAEDVEAVLPRFRGRIRQVPPMVSAVHHEGRRLYELARAGVEVERQPREVEIHRLEMRSFEAGRRARAELVVECSSGTYIRTLSADIGAAPELGGVGGMMESLRRTRVGPFGLEDARSLEGLERRRDGALVETLRTIPEALADWPRVTLTPAEVEAVRRGQAVRRDGGFTGGEMLLLDAGGSAVGLARRAGACLAPFKVFAES